MLKYTDVRKQISKPRKWLATDPCVVLIQLRKYYRTAFVNCCSVDRRRPVNSTRSVTLTILYRNWNYDYFTNSDISFCFNDRVVCSEITEELL